MEKLTEEKIKQLSDNYKKMQQEEKDAELEEYLNNKNKLDFPEEGMSYFDFMVLENAIKQYEQRIRSLLDKK
jgi:hypothetical protein